MYGAVRGLGDWDAEVASDTDYWGNPITTSAPPPDYWGNTAPTPDPPKPREVTYYENLAIEKESRLAQERAQERAPR